MLLAVCRLQYHDAHTLPASCSPGSQQAWEPSTMASMHASQAPPVSCSTSGTQA